VIPICFLRLGCALLCETAYRYIPGHLQPDDFGTPFVFFFVFRLPLLFPGLGGEAAFCFVTESLLYYGRAVGEPEVGFLASRYLPFGPTFDQGSWGCSGGARCGTQPVVRVAGDLAISRPGPSRPREQARCLFSLCRDFGPDVYFGAKPRSHGRQPIFITLTFRLFLYGCFTSSAQLPKVAFSVQGLTVLTGAVRNLGNEIRRWRARWLADKFGQLSQLRYLRWRRRRCKAAALRLLRQERTSMITRVRSSWRLSPIGRRCFGGI